MRAAKVSIEERHRLILECKASGLSDYQWCQLNGIKPGTFYSWIRKFRKEGYPECQTSEMISSPLPAGKQEVVRLEFRSEEFSKENHFLSHPDSGLSSQPDLEILAGTMKLRISNHISPELLKQVMLLSRELC